MMPPGAPRRPPWPGRPAREGGPCPEHRDFARTTWRFGEPGHAGAGRAEPPGADEVFDCPRGGGGSQAETARWDPHFRENEMCPTGRPERPGLDGRRAGHGPAPGPMSLSHRVHGEAPAGPLGPPPPPPATLTLSLNDCHHLCSLRSRRPATSRLGDGVL